MLKVFVLLLVIMTDGYNGEVNFSSHVYPTQFETFESCQAKLDEQLIKINEAYPDAQYGLACIEVNGK